MTTTATRIIELDAMLTANEQELDYAFAILARGGRDAGKIRQTLSRLESERGDLLADKDELLAANVA